MKIRLDERVAETGGITRSQARSLIMEGRVSVDGVLASKAGQSVAPEARIEIERPRRFVSRGGEKLECALDAFAIDVRDRDALDVGASTGGFTDALLQRGAARVTALDVGYGQLDWRLRNDARVRVMERVNFRTLPDDAFPGGFDMITIDASFISLRRSCGGRKRTCARRASSWRSSSRSSRRDASGWQRAASCATPPSTATFSARSCLRASSSDCCRWHWPLAAARAGRESRVPDGAPTLRGSVDGRTIGTALGEERPA